MRDGLRSALAAAVIVVGGAGVLGAADAPQLSADDSLDGEIVITDCSLGNINVCGTQTTKICREWKMTYSGGGSISPTGGGINAGYTATCAFWDERTVNLYKDRRKAG